MTDSLKNIVAINKFNWALIYKDGKYGFMDSNGVETFAPQFEGVDEEYKCSSVKDDVLITTNGLVGRNGKRLADKRPIVKDIGYGFLKVGDDSCVWVLHKSGQRVTESCVQDASVLGGLFLMMKANGLFGLHAFNGRVVLAAQWDSIEIIDGVVILNYLGKKTLCLPSQLKLVPDGNPLAENLVFDNVKSLGMGLLLVNNGSLEGIMNSKLEFVVPLARQSLFQMPFGLVRKINDRFIFAGLAPELENETWDGYQFSQQWLSLKNFAGLKLLDTYSKKIVESHPDSLWFDKGLAFAREGDSVRVHLNSSSRITLARNAKIYFIKSADSIRYFFVEKKNKKIIFSIETGEKLFSTDYDQVESLTSDLFIVTKKNKKGLINKQGKVVLAPEYDALIPYGKGQLSLLKEKKFGLYDFISGEIIKPFFERNISPLDSGIFIAFKDGHYGLIDWSARPVTRFYFDEILPWTKDVIWTKKGFEWSLFDFRQSKDLLRQIKSFHLFSDKPEEKLAIVRQENYFGVLSSKRGMIIPPSFSFITNLGSEEEPLYFTSKEVEEAGIVVVIYYDKEGKMLRKQVYEEEDYARIVCQED